MTDPRRNQPVASTRDLSTFAGQLSAALAGQRAVAFGPGVPLTPARTPEDGPRRFQYPVGVNQISTPRGEYPGLTPFGQLQSLAELYDVAAMCIAVRIEEVQGLQWTVAAKDKRKQRELQSLCDELAGRFAVPDGQDEFDAWISQLLYDTFAIDALTIYPRLDLAGRVVAWEPISGDTIKPVVDGSGRTVAYQQVLYGVPFADYHRPGGDADDGATFDKHELIYRPRWRRTRTPYGFPPSEWIILRVNQALRKQSFDLSYFTEGNIPEAFMIPKGGIMTPDQIREFETYFNALLQGDVGARRRLKFLPFEADYREARSFSYDTALDDWLMRVTCAAYGVPPNELGFTDMVNKASAQVQEAVNERRGLRPITSWLKDLFDRFIPHMGERPYLPPGVSGGLFSVSRPGGPTRAEQPLDTLVEFRWVFGEAEDRQAQATTDKIYVEIGAITKEEVRAMRFADELDGEAPAQAPAPPEQTPGGPPAAPEAPPPPTAPERPAQAPREPMQVTYAADAPPAEKLAKGGGQTGVIVALWCEDWMGESLANLTGAAGLGPYAVERGDHHLTLVHLGEAAHHTDRDRETIRRVLRMMAESAVPVEAELGGVILFPDGEDGTPLAAAVSGQSLSAYREQLAQALASAGYDPTGRGFQPHITLAYLPPSAPRRLPLIGRSPVSFAAVTLAWAGEREVFPFGVRPPPSPGLTKREGDADPPPDAAAREQSERQAAHVFGRALATQRAMVSAELGRAPLQIGRATELWKAVREQMEQLGLPLFEELLADAARATPDLTFTPDWGLVNADVLALARAEAARLAAETTETTRAGVVDAVADWVASGEGREALERSIGRLFGTDRAQLIATTEVTGLYARGNRAAWAASGLVEGYKVKGSADELVCPTCKQFIGNAYPIGDEEHMPPYHPRCRCFLAPVTIPAGEMGSALPATPVAPAQPAETPAERQRRMVRAREDAIRPQRFESAYAVAADGTVLIEKDGGHTYVDFSPEEIAALRGRGAVFTHNHPLGWEVPEGDPRRTGNSFSDADIDVACDAEVAEIRAVTPRRRYWMRPPAGGWNAAYWREILYPTHQHFHAQVRGEFMREIRRGTMTTQEAEAQHNHEVWSRVTKELEIPYGYEEN